MQCTHYKALISANPNWSLVGIYADEGLSGTTRVHRDDFNRMIADAETGKIDLILTKSISRFARNTLDCISVVRRLKKLGVAISFEKEGLDTLDGNGDLLLQKMYIEDFLTHKLVKNRGQLPQYYVEGGARADHSEVRV